MLQAPITKNVLPRTNRSSDYKVWQKLAITRAAQATIEGPKKDENGKEALMLRSFISNCKIIVEKYGSLLPPNTTAEILSQDGLKIGSCLTGKQLWSAWNGLSREIENDAIPTLIRSKILNSDNSIPSGLDGDEILFRFRRFQYDLKYNNLSFSSENILSLETRQLEEDEDDVDEELDLSNDGKKKRGRKKRIAGVQTPFDQNWFPNWWVAFVEHGPLSSNPVTGWTFKSFSSGPYFTDELKIESTSRAVQRKK
jgi:hypothetical protein